MESKSTTLREVWGKGELEEGETSQLHVSLNLILSANI